MDIETEAIAVGASVQAALNECIEALGGSPARPIEFGRRIGLDKSLASRIGQAARAHDPISALQSSPTPQGLKIFESAALEHGLDSSHHKQLRRAIDDVQSLMDRFPDGRSGLDVAITGWLPEMRRKQDRQARLNVHRGMTALAGASLDTFYACYVYSPNPDGKTLDTAWLQSQQGLRRQRGGSSIVLGGIARSTGELTTQRMTLAGQPIGDDARSCLLPELCDGPIDGLKTVSRPGAFLLIFGGDAPPLNVPITCTLGSRARSVMSRFRSADRRFAFNTILLRKPLHWMVVDYFAHKDLFPNSRPVTRSRVGTLLFTEPPQHTTDAEEAEALDIEVSMHDIDPVTLQPRGDGVANDESMVATMFRLIGQNRSDYRAFRVRVEYPLPMSEVTTWFALPEAN